MTPAVQYEAADGTWSKAVLHLLEPANVLRTNGGGGLDPDRGDPAVSGLQERVDLGSGVFAVVVESHRAPGTALPRGADADHRRRRAPLHGRPHRHRQWLDSGADFHPAPTDLHRNTGDRRARSPRLQTHPATPGRHRLTHPPQAAHPPKHRRGTSTCAHQAVATLLMCQPEAA